MSLGSEWDGVRDFLYQLRRVSEAHFEKQGGKWSINEQINHTHSEVSELYESIRSTRVGNNERDHILEETCDIMFSALTNAHILGYNDEEILEGLVSTLRKIQKRVEQVV